MHRHLGCFGAGRMMSVPKHGVCCDWRDATAYMASLWRRSLPATTTWLRSRGCAADAAGAAGAAAGAALMLLGKPYLLPSASRCV
jgi:hypothetical protein